MKLFLALCICALPSSGHWGIGCLSPTSNGPALHGGTAHCCAFSVNTRGPPYGQGFLVPPLLCLSQEMGMEERRYPGDAAGCQQGWLQKPATLHLHRSIPVCAAPCGIEAQLQVIEGLCRRHRALGICLWRSYLQLSEQSFCISNPLQCESLGCAQECVIELPQTTSRLLKQMVY